MKYIDWQRAEGNSEGVVVAPCKYQGRLVKIYFDNYPSVKHWIVMMLMDDGWQRILTHKDETRARNQFEILIQTSHGTTL